VRNESNAYDSGGPLAGLREAIWTELDISIESFEFEYICWDPKSYELYLQRVKSEETLMEARSDTDVQIVRRMWV